MNVKAIVASVGALLVLFGGYYFCNSLIGYNDITDWQVYQEHLCFDGDKPSASKLKLIRLAWDNLRSKYETWLEALAEYEGPR